MDPKAVESNQPPTNVPNPDELARLGHVRVSLIAPANGSVEQAIEIDRNTRIIGQAFFGGQGARYTLVGLSGSELPSRSLSKEPLDGGGGWEVFEVADPPVGPLTVRLTGGAEGGALQLALFFDNGRKLIVQVEPFQVAVDERVAVTARIVDPDGTVLRGDSGSFEGTVQTGDDKEWRLDLRDDGDHADGAAGDGIHGAYFDRTSVEGPVNVEVTGEMRFEGYRTVRSGHQMFLVMPTGASFSGPMSEGVVDADGDGLFELLEFSQEITFTKNGYYLLIGDLFDAQAEMITIARWGVELTEGTGTRIAKLSVRGSDLRRHGVEGPWTLANLRLVREDAGSLEVARAPDHVSAIRPLSKFEPPPPPLITVLMPGRGAPAGGYWITLMGTGLAETESVLIDGRRSQLDLRDDGAVGVLVPQTTRESPGGVRPGVDVSVEVRTRWGRASDPAGFRYEW